RLIRLTAQQSIPAIYHTGLLGSAGVIVMLLSGTAFAQSMRPGINLTPGNRPLSPEEQARQKAVDDAYRSAIEKLPDKKKSADPWTASARRQAPGSARTSSNRSGAPMRPASNTPV
ncbi:MAG: hypothetical protein WBM51_12985, partial [Pseudolabrys sp.]